jgi:hypothetical protein
MEVRMNTTRLVRCAKAAGLIVATGIAMTAPAAFQDSAVKIPKFITPALACARVVPPSCISIANCGRGCVDIANRCNFAFQWHADLRRCRDQTGIVAPGVSIRYTPGCDIRAISMC